MVTIGAMPKLLLNLRGVPDDEADDMRAVLDAQQIAFYETTPSLWGISSGGIWVTEDADFAAAKRAFDDYEQQCTIRVRAEYAVAKRAGTAETIASLLRDDPLRVVATLPDTLVVSALAAVPLVLLQSTRGIAPDDVVPADAVCIRRMSCARPAKAWGKRAALACRGKRFAWPNGRACCSRRAFRRRYNGPLFAHTGWRRVVPPSKPS